MEGHEMEGQPMERRSRAEDVPGYARAGEDGPAAADGAALRVSDRPASGESAEGDMYLVDVIEAVVERKRVIDWTPLKVPD